MTNSATVRRELERRIETIDGEIGDAGRVQGEEAETLDEDEIRRLVGWAAETMEPPTETLLDSEKTALSRTAMELLFDEMPTYRDLDNGTAKVCCIFEVAKNLRDGKDDVVVFV